MECGWNFVELYIEGSQMNMTQELAICEYAMRSEPSDEKEIWTVD
jgi:hypothetical protein